MSSSDTILYYPLTNRVNYLDDIHIDSKTTVLFKPVPYNIASGFNQDNALIMYFSSGSLPDNLVVELKDKDEWQKVDPWDEKGEYMLIIGRTYQFKNKADDIVLFTLEPPLPVCQLFQIQSRHVSSYPPRFRRMLMGME